MKCFNKSLDARRRARKAARKTVIKTGTKVIPDKRRKPEKHRCPCGQFVTGFD